MLKISKIYPQEIPKILPRYPQDMVRSGLVCMEGFLQFGTLKPKYQPAEWDWISEPPDCWAVIINYFEKSRLSTNSVNMPIYLDIYLLIVKRGKTMQPLCGQDWHFFSLWY